MDDTRVKEIMTRDLVNAVEGMTVEEALQLLVNHRVTGLPVINHKKKMVGVLSEYDILQQVVKSKTINREAFQKPIQFSKKVYAVHENMKIEDVLKLFVKKKFRRIPVVDSHKRLVGIITRRDLMRVFYYRAKLES